ncbi:MAG: hypothetical protein AAF703_01855 [Cyanobacteria bacterium P01_D01_bin.105]
MHSRSDLEIKVRLVLGLILLSLVMVLLLRLLLPVLAIAGFIAGGYWLWQQYRNQQQRYQRQQARIHAQFYQLLRQQQGRISVLDFAMRTRLSGADAQDYLNTQAQAFSAFFETTLSGDLIYVFSSSHSDRMHQAQAYQTRANTERENAERAYAQQAQTAWTNAKQIRTLRQLSRQGKAQVMREHIAQVGTSPKLIEPASSYSTPRASKRHASEIDEKTNIAANTENQTRAAQTSEKRSREARLIDIDIEQTAVEQAKSQNYTGSRTIDVTAKPS